MRRKDELGRWGETIAADHLVSDGYDLLDRNWHCRSGEIDLVAMDTGCLVVVEVKTRRTARSGHPLEAVSTRKLGTLKLLAALWLRANRVPAVGVRIDVVGVLGDPRGMPVVDHVRNVTA